MMLMMRVCSHSYRREAAQVVACICPSAPPTFAPPLLSPAAHCSTGLAGCNLHQPIRVCAVVPPLCPTHESLQIAANGQKLKHETVELDMDVLINNFKCVPWNNEGTWWVIPCVPVDQMCYSPRKAPVQHKNTHITGESY